MIESLDKYLGILIFYFPLGIIGVWRWSIWVIKKIIASRYKPTPDNGYDDTLSLVVPVYNEDPDVFQKALESWELNDPDEIIVVIDYTDKACIEKFKEFQNKNKKSLASRLIITRRSGKREALADGIRAARYNIIALVDSDTIWSPDIKKTLLAPFADPSVGGVGPRQDVLKTNTLARRLFNIHLDHRYFDEITWLAVTSNALPCLSGRTALYRKEAIQNEELCYELENEKFLGAKCVSGDDKCITRLVQQEGWKVRYQGNVKVLTIGAADLLTLFKQYLRWTRNSYNSDLKSLFSKWIWKREKLLALHMIDRFTQPFTLLIGPIYMIFSLIMGQWLIAGILVLWWLVSRAIRIFPHLKNRPSDILILPFYLFSTYFLAVIKIYAMISLRQTGWITRWDLNRINTGSRLLRFLRPVPTSTATFLVIVLLIFSVDNYKNVAFGDSSVAFSTNMQFTNVDNIDTFQQEQAILEAINNEQKIGRYTVEKNDTLLSIGSKYGINPVEILKINSEAIKDPNLINVGQLLMIPLSGLRQEENKLPYAGEPFITFDANNNAINVRGEGSLVTLSKIDNILRNKQILEKLNDKEWLLRANLFLDKDTLLLLNGEEVSWLKLKSSANDFVFISSRSAKILIENTKITSWDELAQDYDKNFEDGRSFIAAKYNSRMDIINSELAYLGYGYYAVGQREPYGGSYGVSWKVSEDPVKEYLVTGKVLNSKFHNNYSGIYAFGATGIFFSGNEIYDNAENGFDINESNNLILDNNIARNNAKHGIILSDNSLNNVIQGNQFYSNGLHGIYLDKKSNNNFLDKNTVYANVDGIVLHDSLYNMLGDNMIKGNKNNVRINNQASRNYIKQNKIIEGENGILIYDHANNNIIVSNVIRKNQQGVYIKNAAGNIVKDSLELGANGIEIKLDNYDHIDNFIQRI